MITSPEQDKMAPSLQSWFTVSVLLLLCLVTSTVDADAQSWNYGALGPEKWAVNFTKCGGKMQSPIDVNTSHAVYSADLEFFDFSGYNVTSGVNISLENLNGQTAEVVYSGTPLKLNGGGLPGVYKLAQFHFHWGENDSRGSEHYMDGEHFPMELHLVHFEEGYASASDARSQPFGLAVVGFFFQVSQENNTALGELLNHFDKIKMAGNETEIETFSLLELLPENYQNLQFYRYYGSLTTPPCYETVIWSLAEKRLNISEYQLNIFRDLTNDENKKLVNDFRPIQKHDRQIVITNVKPEESYMPATTEEPPMCPTVESPNTGAYSSVHQMNVILSLLTTLLYLVH